MTSGFTHIMYSVNRLKALHALSYFGLAAQVALSLPLIKHNLSSGKHQLIEQCTLDASYLLPTIITHTYQCCHVCQRSSLLSTKLNSALDVAVNRFCVLDCDRIHRLLVWIKYPKTTPISMITVVIFDLHHYVKTCQKI